MAYRILFLILFCIVTLFQIGYSKDVSDDILKVLKPILDEKHKTEIREQLLKSGDQQKGDSEILKQESEKANSKSLSQKSRTYFHNSNAKNDLIEELQKEYSKGIPEKDPIKTLLRIVNAKLDQEGTVDVLSRKRRQTFRGTYGGKRAKEVDFYDGRNFQDSKHYFELNIPAIMQSKLLMDLAEKDMNIYPGQNIKGSFWLWPKRQTCCGHLYGSYPKKQSLREIYIRNTIWPIYRNLKKRDTDELAKQSKKEDIAQNKVNQNGDFAKRKRRQTIRWLRPNKRSKNKNHAFFMKWGGNSHDSRYLRKRQTIRQLRPFSMKRQTLSGFWPNKRQTLSGLFHNKRQTLAGMFGIKRQTLSGMYPYQQKRQHGDKTSQNINAVQTAPVQKDDKYKALTSFFNKYQHSEQNREPSWLESLLVGSAQLRNKRQTDMFGKRQISCELR